MDYFFFFFFGVVVVVVVVVYYEFCLGKKKRSDTRNEVHGATATMEQRAWKWYTQTDNNTLFLKLMGLCHIMVTKTHNSGIPSNNKNNNNNNKSRSGSILFIPYTEPNSKQMVDLLLAILVVELASTYVDSCGWVSTQQP